MNRSECALLLYLAGDNELGRSVCRLWDILKAVDPGKNCAIAAQCDILYQNEKMSESLRLLKIKHESGLVSLGNVSSGSTAALLDFITWAFRKIEAQVFFLLIFSHSDGFLGLLEDHTSVEEMTIPQLRGVLSQAGHPGGKKIDAIVFDNCWMNMVEILYELRDECHILAGSQEVMPGDGIPLEAVIKGIVRHLDEGPGKESPGCGQTAAHRQDSAHSRAAAFSLARRILRGVSSNQVFVEGGSGHLLCPTFSILDVGETSSLKESLDRLSLIILSLPEAGMITFAAIVRETQRFANYGERKIPYIYYVDIFDLCERILRVNTLPEALLHASNEVARSLERVVKGHFRWGEMTIGSHGLSIFLPTAPQVEEVMSMYSSLAWARDSRWGEIITRIIHE